MAVPKRDWQGYRVWLERDTNMMPNLTLPALILSIGLFASTFWVGRVIQDVKSSGQTITVKGYAEKEVVSDTAVWSARCTVRARQLPPAYAKLQADVQRTQAFLEAQNFPGSAIAIGPVNTEVHYKKEGEVQTGEVESYTLTQTLRLTSDDVEAVDRVARLATSLIQEGIELQSFHPEFYFTKLDASKVELLGLATIDAKQRALQIAEASGGSVGAIRSAQQGVFQITRPFSSEVSNSGEFDTYSIPKVIKAVVTLEYSVR